MKRSIVLSYILLLFATIVTAQAKVKAELDSATILIGQRAYLKVSVGVGKDTKVTFPDYKVQQEIVPGVEVLNVRKDTINAGNERQIVATYVLTGWEQQDYEIPSLQIIVDGKKVSTKSFILKVKEQKVDKKQGSQKPADDIMAVPFSWADLIPAFCWLIVAIILIVAAWLLKKRIRQNKGLALPQKKVKNLTPYEEAMAEIQKLQTAESKGMEQKVYYTHVADVLRKYINKCFHINTLESTSEEILLQLKDKVGNGQLTELKNLFVTADLVKFAKYSTTDNEREYYLSNVLHFVEDTRTVNQVQEEESQPIQEVAPRKVKTHRAMQLVVAALVILAICLLVYVVYDVYQTVV